MKPHKLYVSIKEFANLQKVFTYNALWNIRQRRKTNGFESAFLKIGFRVAIDVDEFWECAKRAKEK